MKSQSAPVIQSTAPATSCSAETAETVVSSPNQNGKAARAADRLSPQAAQRILISLMFPAMIMPITSSMSRVALPVIRDQFQIPADTTAWVTTAFTLPFMVLMPVYGRLSDGVGKRRLILAGIVIFALGTAMTLAATDLVWLLAGRAVQGLGTAGMMPLGLALLSSIFKADERGKALGTWSTVGPTTGFLGPLVAGFLVESWGWRMAYVPPLVIGVLAFVVVARVVPAGLSTIRPRYWRRFDWVGVGLLSAAMATFLFYLSSRPITGVAPLRDWRLLAATLVLMGSFLWWERRHRNPFVVLALFTRRLFTMTSFAASMRMVTMAGSGFLLPLYLVDVHGLSAAHVGGMLMVSPGAMALMVRFGGQTADRWGSRVPVLIGLSVQVAVMALFSLLPSAAPLWLIALLLAFQGLGVGLMLAALHRAAMGNISDEEMGAAAGLYSMVRFAGLAAGTALAGVLLQIFLSQALPTVEAYQRVFLFFAGFPVLGAVFGLGMRE